MNKTDALEMLSHARSAHLQWRARAQALVAGVPLEKEQVPVAYTDCKFGRWYYGVGQRLSSLESFKAIEEPHQSLHLIYMRIFKELFGEDDRSGLAKLFGSGKRRKAQHTAQAEQILPQLVAISQTLLETVDALEKDIRRMSEAEFAEVASSRA
ncbi:MAG: CZB domain-containing protein [Chromatiales bacterium]|jgi:hypothetical protein